jgi:hypothetical protein
MVLTIMFRVQRREEETGENYVYILKNFVFIRAAP